MIETLPASSTGSRLSIVRHDVWTISSSCLPWMRRGPAWQCLLAEFHDLQAGNAGLWDDIKLSTTHKKSSGSPWSAKTWEA